MLTVLTAGEGTSDNRVWRLEGPLNTPELRAQGGAATLLFGGTAPFAPLTEAALLRAGEATECWALADTDTIQRLPDAVLRSLEDRKILDIALRGTELGAYRAAIILAQQTSAAAFRAGARTDWAYSDLASRPRPFRGEVLYVEGRLSNVESIELPRGARESGVPQLYRAVLTDNQSNRYFVRFTELPPGVQSKDVPELTVSFAGYFLKLVPGRSVDAPMMQPPAYPLLVGRSFWVIRTPYQGIPLAAAGLFQACLAGPSESVVPFTELALLQAGERLNYWAIHADDGPPRLRRDLFQFIRDEKWIPEADDDYDATRELLAYYDFLLTAHRTSPEYFRDKARHDVTYAQLFREPAAFRGEVIHLQGKLRRLTHHTATSMAHIGGVEEFYEAWIYNDDVGAHPFCVIFTELPAGLKPGDQLTIPVSFDGYFYKKVQYKSSDLSAGNMRREALLFVGRTLNTSATARMETPSWAEGLVGGFMVVLSIVLVIGIVLGFWYVRSDRRARHRLQLARRTEFVMPGAVPEYPGRGATPETPSKSIAPHSATPKSNGTHRTTERTVGTRSTHDGTLSNEGDTGEPGANAPGG
jgi:hypothetical protein